MAGALLGRNNLRGGALPLGRSTLGIREPGTTAVLRVCAR